MVLEDKLSPRETDQPRCLILICGSLEGSRLQRMECITIMLLIALSRVARKLRRCRVHLEKSLDATSAMHTNLGGISC